MKRNSKILALWLLTIGGFASHSIADLLPLFWGKDLRIATDGNVDQGMIVMMMSLSYLLPACGILCTLSEKKFTKVLNAALALVIALFNVAHALMELPSDNAGQYVVLPMMVAIGLLLAWQSVKNAKE